MVRFTNLIESAGRVTKGEIVVDGYETYRTDKWVPSARDRAEYFRLKRKWWKATGRGRDYFSEAAVRAERRLRRFLEGLEQGNGTEAEGAMKRGWAEYDVLLSSTRPH